MATTLIFTDLDGTLLDAHTYSFEAALCALGRIKDAGAPLILCSSKTAAEIEGYRRKLGNRAPFICENGGGIFVPKGYFPFEIDGEERGDYTVITLGAPYDEIRKRFVRIREELAARARGFGDMDALEVAAITGLGLEQARLAKERAFDEPFVFEDEGADVTGFLKAIEDAGLRWTAGRFYHCLGDNDKGRAVGILKSFYERLYGKVRAVGLGDSLNDQPMLKAVDCPVLVRKPGGGYDKRVDIAGVQLTDGIGPAGWNEAVMRLVEN